ncbi:restriction endonuclease subunit S [Vibrio alginolyticus]
MSSNRTISDIVDFNPKRPIKKGETKPFIEMAALPVDNRDVSELGEREFKGGGSKFKNGDTLFARITPCLENGKTAKVNCLNQDEHGHGSTEFIVMSAKEPEYDEDYVYYLARHPEFRAYAQSRMEGTSGRQRVAWQSLAEFEFDYPDKDIRKEAGKFLKEIDDKVALNAKTNQTLEQIAQTIFKSWFVDFDPVKAKIETLAAGGSADDAELAAMGVISAKTLDELNGLKASNSEAFNTLAQTAALFPAAMQDSELGEIPEGWSYCTFGDISACFDSKRVPLSKRKREEKQPGTIPYYGATSVMDYVNEWIFDDTYLLLGEDGSVVKDDGTPFVQYIWGKSWVNNHAHVLQGNNGVSTEHLMVFIKGTNIASYVTGAVQLKLNQKNMNSIPFLKASTEINLVFQGVLNGLYDAYKNNIESSQSLSSLRDSLLPRLLSGEMELKDKE